MIHLHLIEFQVLNRQEFDGRRTSRSGSSSTATGP